jgi:hypothetical protein
MRTITRAALILAAVILPSVPALAQSTAGFDMSGMNSTANTGTYDNSTYGANLADITNVTNTPYQQSVTPGVGLTSDPQLVPGSYTTNNADGTTSVTQVLGNQSLATGQQGVALQGSTQSLLAPGSWFGNTAIPTGDSLGFPAGVPKIYNGVTNRLMNFGGILPQTSTAEVILNIVE